MTWGQWSGAYAQAHDVVGWLAGYATAPNIWQRRPVCVYVWTRAVTNLDVDPAFRTWYVLRKVDLWNGMISYAVIVSFGWLSRPGYLPNGHGPWSLQLVGSSQAWLAAQHLGSTRPLTRGVTPFLGMGDASGMGQRPLISQNRTPNRHQYDMEIGVAELITDIKIGKYCIFIFVFIYLFIYLFNLFIYYWFIHWRIK